jgi:hypothetical protein
MKGAIKFFICHYTLEQAAALPLQSYRSVCGNGRGGLDREVETTVQLKAYGQPLSPCDA